MPEQTRGVYPVSLKESFADERTRPFWEAAVQGRLTAPKCASDVPAVPLTVTV